MKQRYLETRTCIKLVQTGYASTSVHTYTTTHKQKYADHKITSWNHSLSHQVTSRLLWEEAFLRRNSSEVLSAADSSPCNRAEGKDIQTATVCILLLQIYLLVYIYVMFMYSTHGLKQDNSGLSNAHNFLCPTFSSRHFSLCFTQSEPTLSTDSKSIVTRLSRAIVHTSL